MTVTARGTDAQMVIDQANMLDAVQTSLRATIAAAPWPRALLDVVTDVLSDRTRALGGRVTPWMLMPLCCCMAVSGDWRRALPAATAAECYVTALDLLDDVEDGDASVMVDRYGAPIVLNVATALLALAHEALGARSGALAAQHSAQDALWHGLLVATGGQHLDLAAAGAPPLPAAECLDIARRKGGALAEACCRAGAAMGTTDAALVEQCGVLGRSIGLHGQLDNDMRDAADESGKSDLVRRKQTVPIAMARTGDDSSVLSAALLRGGIQLAYALLHAERARAQETLERIAAACPDPAAAAAILTFLLDRHGAASAGAST